MPTTPRPKRQKRPPPPVESTGVAPPAKPLQTQVSVRVDSAQLARMQACAQDAAWHGGATVSLPTLLLKALWNYLSAYDAERQAD